jgi:hypothetical protein
MKRKMKTVYYAHSKTQYGSDVEYRDIAFLARRFNVVCPHNTLGQLPSIEQYLNAVRECNAVVVRCVTGFIVGLGVFQEIREALKCNLPVFVLCGKGMFTRRVLVERVVLVQYGGSPEEQKQCWGRVILMRGK